MMPYQVKPLSCDSAKIRGMSERMIISHYENNYGGAVKRLNLIEEQLAELDYARAAGFVINGLKREQLIAMNSMILHELFFDAIASMPAVGTARWMCSSRRETRTIDWRAYRRLRVPAPPCSCRSLIACLSPPAPIRANRRRSG